MMPTDNATQDPELGEQLARLRTFLRRTLRFWPTVLITLIVGGLAFCVFSYFRQPKYRSETVILYVERRTADDDVYRETARQAVSVRLKELLYARPNLERVIKKFELYPEIRKRYGMVDAVEELKKDVEFRAPGGDTFSIAFDGTSPTQAQRVTAELARLVIEGDSDLRKRQARMALDFLAGERKSRETELREAEEKLASFMAKHPRFALDATPLANGAAIRASMGGVAPAPPSGRQNWAAPSRATPAVGSSGAPSGGAAARPAGPGAGDPEESRARAALAAAREDLTEKLAHYTPAHPDVRAAEAAVQRATERLGAVQSAPRPAAPAEPVAAAPAPAPAPATSATTPAPRAPAPMARAATPIAPPVVPAPAAGADGNQTLVDLETQWLQLTRAVTEARQRQDQIEAQLFRADIQVSSESGGHGAQVNVIDPAFEPLRPLPPGRTTLAAIFLIVSLVLGCSLALLRAATDERLFAAADAAGLTDVLVEVPRMMKRRAHAAT
jgi:polysaccharide biosynthesis transport protein